MQIEVVTEDSPSTSEDITESFLGFLVVPNGRLASD